MSKSDTPGKIISLLHLGHSVRDRGEAMKFYNEDMDAKACRIQRSDAPYIGEVNGVKGAQADLAFIEYGENRPMIELLDFINPVDVHCEYKPGEAAYSHVGFRTKDVSACYDRMLKKGLKPLTPPQRADCGYGKGKGAFLLADPDNTYVQVLQDDEFVAGDGMITDQSHVALSVPDIDKIVPVFRDLLCCDVEVEDTGNSRYLSALCEKTVSRMAVCRSRLENYVVEVWETGDDGGVEDIHISASGTVHLCYLCGGIDDLYGRFKDAGMRFVNEPVTVTKGINQGSKAIFFQTPGYLWVELLCRKADL
jgi:catechol 2,3-dioxygenase-like lactoylglutathione lyase family enzyme